MIRVSKIAFSLGGVVLGAGLLALAVPKAAHAVAAVLVQVTNTASNPVITESVGHQASQAVVIRCEEPNEGCVEQTGYEQSGSFSYTVPQNQYLVITAVDISSAKGLNNTPCNTGHFFSLSFILGADFEDESWLLAANSGTLHLAYPSGMVFRPGTQLTPAGAVPGCIDRVQMFGYLTAQ